MGWICEKFKFSSLLEGRNYLSRYRRFRTQQQVAVQLAEFAQLHREWFHGAAAAVDDDCLSDGQTDERTNETTMLTSC